ncbi:MAG: aromatic ring-hydroxylating dioxygenase subunit alpha [bacterium]|nr:aromatic ring-hydroxylating dioxygenase subunit alpha [bacterium]
MIQDLVLLNDWHCVAFAAQLGEGQMLPARLLGEDIVLWRLNGRVMAWQDLCIHRGAKLSLGRISGETLICPYHGWTYNSEGRCVKMPAHPDQTPPAKAVVKTYQVCERYGMVWVCPGEPANEPPPFEEWDDASFRKVACGPYAVPVSAPRLVENFLDVAHFPYVHEGYLGDPQYPEIADYEVSTTGAGVLAENIRVYQPDPDGTGIGREVTYTYKVPRPLTAYFTKSGEGPKFAIFFTITPVTPLESVGWMWVCMNYAHDLPEVEVRGFQDMIFSQDVPVVASQRPELLPLDLQAELHLRSDKTAIAYRRWLNELGLTFGTA